MGDASEFNHGNTSRPPIEVRRSTRRRKTAAAHMEGGRIIVVVPSHWSRGTREEVTERLVARILKRRSSVPASDEALAARAAELSDLYLGGIRPTSIRWVTNQNTLWGSCTTAAGVIRLSSRLREVPSYVLDSVIVHELAHLERADHSAEFHALVNRYPRTADANRFLEGFSLGLRIADR